LFPSSRYERTCSIYVGGGRSGARTLQTVRVSATVVAGAAGSPPTGEKRTPRGILPVYPLYSPLSIYGTVSREGGRSRAERRRVA
jgi:hypothetical protein